MRALRFMSCVRMSCIGLLGLGLILGGCSSREVPVQSSGQGGGGNMTGNMSYPNPLPQGNLSTTVQPR